MKKVFFALAVVAMFSFVACNGNAAAEDTTAQEPVIEEAAQEMTEESTEAVEGMAEEVAAEAEAVVAE